MSYLIFFFLFSSKEMPNPELLNELFTGPDLHLSINAKVVIPAATNDQGNDLENCELPSFENLQLRNNDGIVLPMENAEEHDDNAITLPAAEGDVTKLII